MMTESQIRSDADDSRVLTINRPAHFRGNAQNKVFLSLQDGSDYINIIVDGAEFVEAIIEQFKDG